MLAGAAAAAATVAATLLAGAIAGTSATCKQQDHISVAVIAALAQHAVCSHMQNVGKDLAQHACPSHKSWG